jgi:glycosyltransferase involved in cell wall biosynthesis
MAPHFSIILPLMDSSDRPDQPPQAVSSPTDLPTQYVMVACASDGADIPAAGCAARNSPRDQHFGSSRWIDRPGISATEGINLGLQHCDGAIVGWLPPGSSHCDDALAAVADFFQRRPDLDVVYGDALILDELGNALGERQSREFSPWLLKRGCSLIEPAVFLRRRVIEKHGVLDPRWKFWADYDYWLRLEAAGVRFERIPRLLAICRVPGKSNHLGVLPRERTTEGLAELNDLLAERLGKVPARWIIHYGRVAAMESEAGSLRDGVCTSKSSWKQAVAANQEWNGRAWWSPDTCLRLPVRLAVAHWRTLVRRPDVIKEITPKIAQKLVDRFLKRRIFRLRHHDPRPLAIPASYARTRPPTNPFLISIVTPNLNQGKFLEATLRSVLDQDYPRLEYIVQDGGSSDGSIGILRRYAPRLKRWTAEPDAGQADAVNRGMQHATGDVLAYLNSDDLFLPGSLAYVACYFADHPDVDIVYGHRVLIDERGDEIGRWVLPPHDDAVLPLADYIPQETMFWRRRAWERVGARLDVSFQFAMDWDLILRFRAAGLKFARLPRFLGAFRISDNQKTQSLLATVGRREMDVLRERALGRVPSARDIRRSVRPYIRRHWLFDKLYLAGLVRY